MSHLKIIVPAFILSGFLISTNIAQADYQHEVNFGHAQSDYDDGATSDTNLLFYRFFFNKVSTSTGPWLETPFTQRAGYIMVLTAQGSYSRPSYSSDSQTAALFATIANPDSDFVFGLDYSQSNADINGTTSYTAKGSTYSLSIGYYVQQYTSINFDHDNNESEFSNSSPTIENETNTISAKTLLLQNNGTAIQLFASYSKREDDDGDQFKTTRLSGGYYFNQKLGLGASLSKDSTPYSSLDSTRTGINLSYFINPQLYLSAHYSQTSYDSSTTNNDSDSMQFDVAYRF